MKKIAILYICTGPYVVFWEEFFNSFENYFLKDIEKHYFVFTDAKAVPYENDCKRIHKIFVDPLPWPLPTLLKFHTFLKIEDQLSKFDYIYQSNANIVSSQIVKENDFLPNSALGEELMFVIHPGYREKRSLYSPFERNKKCHAYVPYICKKKYVFGAMNGGTATAYLKMISELSKNIDEDLKNNVIARWHDESYINNYVYKHNNIKLLSPSYCYPVGLEIEEPPIIVGVIKKTKFDVDSFKGYYKKKRNVPQKLIYGIKRFLNDFLKPNILFIIGNIFRN